MKFESDKNGILRYARGIARGIAKIITMTSGRNCGHTSVNTNMASTKPGKEGKFLNEISA